jgi:cell division protein FtsQ
VTSSLLRGRLLRGDAPEDGTPEDAAPRRPGRPSRRALIIAGAAVAVVVVLVVWLVAFSSLFGARSVQVRGVHSLSAAEVDAAADVPHGHPLVRLDTDGIARRVEALPDVASATVTTSFPSTVVIRVTERVAIGYVVIGGKDRLVDSTGLEYRAVTKAPSKLPLFVVPSGTGSRRVGSAVATVASSLPASVRAKVQSIQALDPVAISLVLDHGVLVHWGSAARSTDKARILPALLAQKGSLFDVTDPDQPFSRP